MFLVIAKEKSSLEKRKIRYFKNSSYLQHCQFLPFILGGKVNSLWIPEKISCVQEEESKIDLVRWLNCEVMTVTYPVNIFVCPEGYDFFELSRHNDVIAKSLTSVDLTSAKQNIVDISFYKPPDKPPVPFLIFSIFPNFRRYRNTNKIRTKWQTRVLYHYSYFASHQSSCTQPTPKQSLSWPNKHVLWKIWNDLWLVDLYLKQENRLFLTWNTWVFNRVYLSRALLVLWNETIV